MRARAEVSKEPNEFLPATCRDLSENGDTNQGLNITVAKETLNEGFTDVKLADRAFYDPKETVILFLILIFLHRPLPTKKKTLHQCCCHPRSVPLSSVFVRAGGKFSLAR